MKKILNEELSTQLRLISYDRSLTLYEQDEKTISDQDIQDLLNFTGSKLDMSKFENLFSTLKKNQEKDLKRFTLELEGLSDNPELNNLYLSHFKNNQSVEMSTLKQKLLPVTNSSTKSINLNDKKAIQMFTDQDKEYFNSGDWTMRDNPDVTGMDILVSVAHVVLPIASVIVMVFAAPLSIGVGVAVAVGFVLESLDALIYLEYDEDPYAAGLAFIFACLGPFDLYLKLIPKNILKSIIIKVAKKIPFNLQEKPIMIYIKKNWDTLFKLSTGRANQFALLKAVTDVLKKGVVTAAFVARMPSKTLGFCLYIIKTFKIGIKILSYVSVPILTWDYLASKLGICNSVDMKELKKSRWWLLKLLGNIGEFTQIYSTTCYSIELKKLIEKMEEDNTPKNILILTLKTEIIDGNRNIDIKYKNIYGDIVKGIQMALVALGYNQRVESFEEKHKELINTNKVYSLPAAKDWDPKDKYYKDPLQKTEYGNNVQYKKNQYGQWFKYNNLYKSWEYLNHGFDRDNDVAKELSKRFKSDDGSWVKGNPLSPVNVGSATTKYYDDRSKSALKVLTKNLHYFKLGYYDYNTEEMVKQYQRDKNIKSDGIFGSGTAKQMIKDLKTLTGDIGTWFDLETSKNEDLKQSVATGLYNKYKDVNVVQDTSKVDVEALENEVIRTVDYLVKNDSLLVTESDLNKFNEDVKRLDYLLNDATLTDEELEDLKLLIYTDSTSIKK